MNTTRICVACTVEFKVKLNGLILVEMSTIGPMAIFRADLWHCPTCGFEAVLGVANEPELRYDEAAFADRLSSYLVDPTARVVKYWANPRERAEHLQYVVLHKQGQDRGTQASVRLEEIR